MISPGGHLGGIFTIQGRQPVIHSASSEAGAGVASPSSAVCWDSSVVVWASPEFSFFFLLA